MTSAVPGLFGDRRRLSATVFMVVVGALTPVIAHAIGGRCWLFLPAHVPALLAGLALGVLPGLAVGLATALVDEVAGGRLHGLALLPLAVEFVVYGLVAGWRGRTTRTFAGLAGALLAAMLAGRIAHLLVALALGHELPWLLKGLFVLPWPGMALQLVFLPGLARRLRALATAPPSRGA